MWWIWLGEYILREISEQWEIQTYQEGSRFIDYGLIHIEMIDAVDQMTYDFVWYQKHKWYHRGWYFDIHETALFLDQIDGVYQSKRRSLQSKDFKQPPDYLKAVEFFWQDEMSTIKTKN